MTNPKSGTGLSVGAQTYCKSWIRENLYNRRKEFTSKQTDKGIKTEDDAIDYLADCLGWGFALKNDVKKSDGFMKGLCDVVLPDEIPDIKSCYDCFSFPLLETKIPEPLYEWQIQGYLNLWNKPKGSIIYVLMDMPEEMIRKEARWKLPQYYTELDFEEFSESYLYSHLPKELRVKRFEVKRDDVKIQAIKDKVLDCRAYIDSVMTSMQLNNEFSGDVVTIPELVA